MPQLNGRDLEFSTTLFFDDDTISECLVQSSMKIMVTMEKSEYRAEN